MAAPPPPSSPSGPPLPTVREAGPDDLDAVVGLEERCLGVDAWTRALLAGVVAGEVPHATALVAEVAHAGEPATAVGHAVVSAVGEVSELQRIAVDRAHRRRGVAGALLARVVALAQEEGSERLLLEVRVDNAAALAFYRAQGFADLGRREGYYRDGAPALVLARALGRMVP